MLSHGMAANENCSKLFRRGEQDSDDICSDVCKSAAPRLACVPSYSILHTNCTGSSLEKDQHKKSLPLRICAAYMLERSFEARADCSKLYRCFLVLFTWFFLERVFHVRLLLLAKR